MIAIIIIAGVASLLVASAFIYAYKKTHLTVAFKMYLSENGKKK